MKSYKKILNQVPPDYYEHGIRSNLFQWAWHSWKFWYLKKFAGCLRKTGLCLSARILIAGFLISFGVYGLSGKERFGLGLMLAA